MAIEKEPLKGKRKFGTYDCAPQYKCYCSSEKTYCYSEYDIKSAVEWCVDWIKKYPHMNQKQQVRMLEKAFEDVMKKESNSPTIRKRKVTKNKKNIFDL